MAPKLRGRAAALAQMQGAPAPVPTASGLAGGPPPLPPPMGSSTFASLGRSPAPLERTTFADRVGDVKDGVEASRAEYRSRVHGALGNLPSAGPSQMVSGMHHKFLDLEVRWGEVMDMSRIDPFSAVTPQVNAASAALSRNRKGLHEQVDAVIADLWDGVSSGQARTMTDARKDDMMMGILSSPGMQLAPQIGRGGFAADRNRDGVPDILQYKDFNGDGVVDFYQTREERARGGGYPGGAGGGGYPSGRQNRGDRNRARSAPSNRGGMSPYQYQVDFRSREGYDSGMLDRKMYQSGDRNFDGIHDDYQQAHLLDLDGDGIADTYQARRPANQMVEYNADRFQLASPRNMGRAPPVAAQDYDARRQLEMMRNAVAELEAQVMQAVEADEEEGDMPPPPPLVQKGKSNRPDLKAFRKADEYEQLARKIQSAGVGAAGDSGSTPINDPDTGQLVMYPPKGGTNIRHQIEQLQRETQELREATVEEVGGEAASRRMLEHEQRRRNRERR